MNRVVVKITTGELDNDLMTNQSIVGKTSQEIAGQTVLECEFYDYKNRRLSPTEIMVRDATTNQLYQITDEATEHRIGQREGGNLLKMWSITNENLLVLAGESTSTRVITNIDYFRIESLTTIERSYSEFDYQLN